MASNNAKLVARDVIKNSRKRSKIVMGEIIKKRGYGSSTVTHPKRVTSTKSYQDEISPFVDEMIKERDAAIADMKRKRKGAKYRDLTDSIDKLTKNINLIQGKPTENKEYSYSWED